VIVENERNETEIIACGSILGIFFRKWKSLKKLEGMENLKILDLYIFSTKLLLLSEDKEKREYIHLFSGTKEIFLDPFMVPENQKVKKIQHNFQNGFAFLTENGKIYVYGNNNEVCNLGLNQEIVKEPTQLPQKTFDDHPIVDFSFGVTYMLVLTSDGSLYSCGKCSRGCLGYTFFSFFKLIFKIIKAWFNC
jgi:hypothetical protein